MKFEELVKSKSFKVWSIVIISLVCAVIIFAAGVFTGLEKARFSLRWDENYPVNFVGKSRMPFGMPQDKNFMNAHGSAGNIIRFDSDGVIIKDRAGDEKNILVDNKTVIKNDSRDLKISDLRLNDYIVVIGTPNDSGEVQAKFIRILINISQ